MYCTICPPQRLRATITLPSSKSISNRLLIINRLANSTVLPQNISDCDDTVAMIKALRAPQAVTNIGAAGTAMRFLTAYFAATPGTTILTGSARMQQRPINELVDALKKIGAIIAYEKTEGYPPLRIEGRVLEGGEITMAGNISSQYTSALLMIAPILKKGLRLRLTGKITSRPYIDMTLQLMKEFGAIAEWKNEQTLEVAPQGYSPKPFLIENDWSAASYWYEMIALSNDQNAEVRLPGLFNESSQGDAFVKEMFLPLGVRTDYKDGMIILRKGEVQQEQMDLPMEKQPDLAQTIAVTCAMLGRPFRLTGLHTLRIKETDRLLALQTELGKLGINIDISDDDTLSWDGTMHKPQDDIIIETYDDHRMAMSFAPTALRHSGISINHPEVVTKSYPKYWEDLKTAGFTISTL
ncbi:MAG: 3-phosphoshikimate 1-carboxyvinyltransferase [Bacteroidaceae bacterium]|nr:3-phosphoshikimate 1-carboxyvinyltransferase [Bacteroidaceae bacterium]